MIEYKLCKIQLHIRFLVYYSICNCLLCLSHILNNKKIFFITSQWHYKLREILELKNHCINDYFLNVQTYKYLFQIYDNVKELSVPEIKEHLLTIYPEIGFNKNYN